MSHININACLLLPALTRTAVGLAFSCSHSKYPCWFPRRIMHGKVLRGDLKNKAVNLTCLFYVASGSRRKASAVTRWGCAERPRPSAALFPNCSRFIAGAPLSLYVVSESLGSSFLKHSPFQLFQLIPISSLICLLHTHTHTPFPPHLLLMSFMQIQAFKVKLFSLQTKVSSHFNLSWWVGRRKRKKSYTCHCSHLL